MNYEKSLSYFGVVTVLLVLLSIGIPTLARGDYDLYATMGDSSFTYLDPVTGEATLIGKAGAQVYSMTYDLQAEVIYSIGEVNDPELVTIDPQTGVGTVLGPFLSAAPDSVYVAEAIAYNPDDGLLYCSVGLNSYDHVTEALATIDPATRQVTVLGYFDGTFANDGDAMEFIDGILYLIDDPGSGPSYLYTVDYTTTPGQATLIGILDNPRFNNVNDLAYNPDTDTLYGFDSNARLLISIDWSIAQGDTIGTTHDPEDFNGTLMTGLTIGPPWAGGISETTEIVRPLANCQIFPNPFSSVTTVTFQLLSPCHVDLDVYDLSGRLVTTLVKRRMHAGSQSITWNGRDVVGQTVSSGVYFALLRANNCSETIKLLLLR